MEQRDQYISKIFQQLVALKKALHSRHDTNCPYTRQQQELMLYLHHHGQETIGAIADFMGTTPSAVTQLVEGLVKIDILERQPDQSDRRVVHVQLALHGQKAMRDMSSQRLEIMRTMFNTLTEQELQQFHQIFEKIIQSQHS
jgi:DNA-binding MarR family transcriptional regulator